MAAESAGDRDPSQTAQSASLQAGGEASAEPVATCTSCKVISAVVPAASVAYLLSVGFTNPQKLAGRRLLYHRFSIGILSLALSILSVSSVFDVGIFDKNQKISMDNLTDLNVQKQWLEKDLNTISEKSKQIWTSVKDGWQAQK